jgi:hypothetical protein
MLGSFSRVAMFVFEYIRFLSLQEEGVIGRVCALPANRPGGGKSADWRAVIMEGRLFCVLLTRGFFGDIQQQTVIFSTVHMK